MKKFISLALCVIMCMTMFTATATQVLAVGDATELITVTSGEFKDNKITYTISVAPNTQKITGVILEAHFDGEALKATASGSSFSGMYETGLKYNQNGVYAIAYMDMNGYTVGNTAKEFATITFEAISDVRDMETVEFKCVEFVTDDGNADNDIVKANVAQRFYTDTFHTLTMPKVTEVNSVTGGLEVMWTESVGATGYKVYRKTAQATEWNLLNENALVNSTSFADTSAQLGTEYFYTVAAVNDFGATDYDEIGVAGMNFGSIASISATILDNGAKISWSALAGAQSYEVYRKLSTSTDGWMLIKTVSACEYTDASILSGVEYDYRVRAISGKYSAGMSCDPATVKFIAIPYATVYNVTDGIEISVEPVGGAVKYIIEKKIGNGAYQVLVELADADVYTDEAVVVGTQYSYRVQAVSADNISSAKNTLATVIRIGTPVLTQVKNTADGISLKWNAVSGATKYEISRKTGDETIWTTYETTALSYVDRNVISGVKYTYTVSALNNTGNGAGSEPPVSVMYLASPAVSSVAAVRTGIEVKWNAVSGAETYNVYRAETGKTNWTVIGSTDALSYVDTTCQFGVYYKYAVSAAADSFEGAYNTTGVEGMYFGNVSWINATPISNGSEITWEDLEKATAYEVYRKTESEANWTKLAKVTTAKYTDTRMASGVVYFYMVKAYNGNNVSDMICTPASVKIIATPTGIAKNVNNGIQITITPVNGATGYVIEKKVGSTFQKIATLGANETTFVDTDVVADTSYTYRVYAISPDLNSEIYEVGTVLRLSCPKITSASNLVPGITMTWTPIDDAVGYEILRKEEGDRNWEVIATVTDTTYVDADVFNDTLYTYTINAIMADGGKTGYDEKGRSVTFVDTPDLLSVSNTVGGVLVKWTPIEGATSYRVYRRGAGSTYWYYLGDVTDTSFIDKETGTSSSIKSGEYFRYTVRAVNSYYSGFDTNGLYLKYVASPKLTGISNSTNGITIKWNAVKGVTNGYRVYRRGAGATYWYYLGTVKTTTFTDSAIKNANGNYYRYTVIADAGTHSAFDTTGLYIKRLSDPTLVSAKSSSAGIKVTWKAVTGSNGYYVYRKTAGTSWVRIGTVGATTSFTDKTAKKGTTYTYTVRAYSGGTTSYFSTKGISCKDLY